jgi:hypothetical protein
MDTIHYGAAEEAEIDLDAEVGLGVAAYAEMDAEMERNDKVEMIVRAVIYVEDWNVVYMVVVVADTNRKDVPELHWADAACACEEMAGEAPD